MITSVRRFVRFVLSIGTVTVMTSLAGCAALSAKQVTIEDRLEMFPGGTFPVDEPVTIRWNDHQVPFVEAQNDDDLAFALGLAHFHLRGGQMTLLKRIAHGRLSESAGPFTTEIDHALRIIDFAYASEDVVKNLPPDTKSWVANYVRGLNYYQDNMKKRPPEFGLLNLRKEPWRMEDVITIGRIASTDVNWLTLLGLMGERVKPEWEKTLANALEAGADPVTSFSGTRQRALLTDILAGMSRSGSNSWAVSPEKSATGSALIASDPHLGLVLPNLWILAGMKSPNYHAVGFMIPGVPIVGVGRNPDMAWGGTNLRAAVSDLYDVARADNAQIVESESVIKTRLWFNKTVTLRRSAYGPILSDSDFLAKRPGEEIAIKWIGHEPRDQVTALLAAARASTPQEFREAFKTFAVSAQNMVFADKNGNIGQIIATTLPVRQYDSLDDIVLDPSDPKNEWQGYVNATDLPWALNPPEGFIASANNRPAITPVPLGFFFGGDDRVRRLQDVLASKDKITMADLTALQLDTKSPDAAAMNAVFVEEISRLEGLEDQQTFIDDLKKWDGDYQADSRGPVVFETLLYHLTPAVYGVETAEEVPALQLQWHYLAKFLVKDMKALEPETRRSMLRASVIAAAKDASNFENWGDMHQLKVGHLLSNAPVIGGRYVIEEFGVSGSRETPMKTAHNLVNEKHSASYGSQARHISDMSDMDENYFLLFGGEDGWIGSENFADMMPLWREGNYVRMPLRPETVAKEFKHVLTLSPQ